ncbi:hypothetical protein BS50DRAFT_581925 [Corynespora cassiicola Philippines]|uniref:Enoyl reductase (ER) domain-containing protein n=1 Tax=Corynespora cassiicola Philippines TaxID=1448308 RepID=A0A2T2PC26_CORCC|nr:hypothetical protein BS50DRAFT_581925 [Corynespora cassiicola Philippines]
MSSMKAWQFTSATGGLEKNLFLPATGIPRPSITDDQILVEVFSMAVNPADYKVPELGLAARAVMPATATPGMDFCGRIVEVGNKVKSLKADTMVFGAKLGASGRGSLGQYISVSSDQVAVLPEGVGVDDAASSGVVGLTEYQAIRPNVREGDKVFINGGSGGTGVFGIQIAKALGCHVTTTCSTPNVELCKSLGADEVIDYKTVDIATALAEKGPVFNVAIDNVGTPSNLFKVSHTFLVPDARFVQVGMPLGLGAIGQLAGNMLLPGFLGGGKRRYQLAMAQAQTEHLEQIGRWLQEGKVRAVLDGVFDFDDAPKAYEKLKTGRARGKIVVRVKKAAGADSKARWPKAAATEDTSIQWTCTRCPGRGHVSIASSPIRLSRSLSSASDMPAAVHRHHPLHPRPPPPASLRHDIDYTVKVESGGLEPFTTYYYQSTVCGSENRSPIGRTKTSPGAEDDAARKNNVDYVLHLGDYIYETGRGTLGSDARATNPIGETFSLYDYRTKIAQYRTDLDLLLSHQQFPWIPMWDDQEVTNSGYRDGFSNMNNTEDSFLKPGRVSVDQRKMNAVRASNVDLDDNLRIRRSFSMGKLLDLIMLDTRNCDRSITTLNWNNDYIAELKDDAGRSLMGSHQENWFYNQLAKSASRGATWRLVGNQIIFSRINNTARSSNWLNADQWDVRSRILHQQASKAQTLLGLHGQPEPHSAPSYSCQTSNTAFLAGDSHANWVSDLVWLDEMPYDRVSGERSIGVEFAGTAVSSTGLTSPSFGGTIANANAKAAGLVKDNKELQWNEVCPTVASHNPFEISLANFTIKTGDNHL